MSINNIISNPVILKELSDAINLILPTTGITELINTDGNINVSVAGNTGNVNLNQTVGITTLNMNGNINMTSNIIDSVYWIGNKNTDIQQDIDIFSNWDNVNNTWGGEIYLNNTGVYIDTVQATNNLVYDNNGNLSNYNSIDAYPPTITPKWSISGGGNAILNNVNIKNVIELNGTTGITGQFLTSGGSGVPTWSNVGGGTSTSCIYFDKGQIPVPVDTVSVITSMPFISVSGKTYLISLNCTAPSLGANLGNVSYSINSSPLDIYEFIYLGSSLSTSISCQFYGTFTTNSTILEISISGIDITINSNNYTISVVQF